MPSPSPSCIPNIQIFNLPNIQMTGSRRLLAAGEQQDVVYERDEKGYPRKDFDHNLPVQGLSVLLHA
ncbi:hypothetical protein Cni_G28111 [Canna indica]|uniref:Uncharacterized protein n=1 Tax=Canna indica TaxID=4628 RepID=A0AAQ3L652_9LILI|nr:hypothetical protein Cni_G28111 [Canna indica]